MTGDQIYMEYTLPLQDELFTVNQILDRNGECHFKSRKEEVEQLIKAVVGSMLRVSKLNLPYTKFNKHMKPYWRYNKDTLNETHGMKERPSIYGEIRANQVKVIIYFLLNIIRQKGNLEENKG